MNRYGLIVKDIRKAMLVIAAYFFDYPDRKLKTIGVTGTKGKTTTVFYLKSIFDEFSRRKGKMPAGLISGISIYDGLNDVTATLTTPEAIPLYRHIANAVKSGLEYMIIEVSSQALKYDRINCVEFDASIFLNIGNDHVSAIEHPTFEDYFSSKLLLAKQSKFFVFNEDMDHHDKVREYVESNHVDYMDYSISGDTDIKTIEINQENLHSRFKTKFGDSIEEYSLIQPGKYNVENAMATILVSKHFGLDYDTIKTGLENAVVEGRDEVFVSDDNQVVAWVSYAHNGISFKKSYEVIHENFPNHKIISIFGGSGDKAVDRLFDVSTFGAKNSDYILLVPDDPGDKPYQEVVSMMADIIKPYGVEFEIFEQRIDGIKRAFEMIDGPTVLFVAGKGNDKYNYINGEYVTIEGDVDVTKLCLEKYNKK